MASRTGRRAILRIGAGLAIWVQMASLRRALAAGKIEKGVYRVRGDVRVNGVRATQGMDIKAGDRIETGPNAEIVFVINRDALLVRSNARVDVLGTAGALLATGLRIVTGAVLSVYASGERRRIETPTATIGIRGTGIYVDAMSDKTYVCTCYGIADIEPAGDPASRETIRTSHHEQPRYVMAKGAPQMLMGAPVVDHTDAELMMLESLVGRVPPFGPEPYR